MLWLAAGVMALAWLLRPAPETEIVPPAGAAFLPTQDEGTLEVASLMELEAAPFNPEWDLHPVVVTPFVEHAPGEWLAPPVLATPTTAPSLPVGTVRLPTGQYQLPSGEVVGDVTMLAPSDVLVPSIVPWSDPGPWTEAETWEWIMTRPVIVLYPELADRLYQDLQNGIARGLTDEPWRAIASLEVWVKDHPGTILSSGRRIAPGYITTEYGTPDHWSMLPQMPFPYTQP